MEALPQTAFWLSNSSLQVLPDPRVSCPHHADTPSQLRVNAPYAGTPVPVGPLSLSCLLRYVLLLFFHAAPTNYPVMNETFHFFKFLFQRHLYSFTYVIPQARGQDTLILSYLISEIAETLSWDKLISYLRAEYHSIYSSYMFHDPWAVRSCAPYPPVG